MRWQSRMLDSQGVSSLRGRWEPSEARHEIVEALGVVPSQARKPDRDLDNAPDLPDDGRHFADLGGPRGQRNGSRSAVGTIQPRQPFPNFDMVRTESDSDTRGNALVGSFALLAGIFAAAFIVVLFVSPSPTPPNVLTSYTSGPSIYGAMLAVSVIFAFFGILFFRSLGRLLAPKSPRVASGAALLSALGLLVMALWIVLFVSALTAITSSPSGPTYQAIARYQAAFWSNLGFSLVFGGSLFAAGGLILFGWLAWRTEIVPGWLSYVAFVGGAAGLFEIALPGFISFILVIVLVAAVVVWGLVIGVLLLRTPATRATVTMGS